MCNHRHVIVTTLAFAFGSSRITSAQDWVSAIKIAPPPSDGDRLKIAATSHGGLYFCGAFRDAVQLADHRLTSAGKRDVFLAKLDPDGNFLWATSGGSAHDEWPYHFSEGKGGSVVIIGNSELHYNLGTLRFGKCTIENGAADSFAACYAPDGKCLSLAGIRDCDANSAACGDAQGRITAAWVGADRGGCIPLNPGAPRSLCALRRNSIPVDEQGQSEYLGYGKDMRVTTVAAIGDSASFVAGSFVKQGQLGKRYWTQFNSRGTRDIFVAKITDRYETSWVRQAGAARIVPGELTENQAFAIDVDGNGNCYVAGIVQGHCKFGGLGTTANGESDGFLAKYRSDGTCVWVRQLGGPGQDLATRLVVDSDGDSTVLGWFEKEAQLGKSLLRAGSSKSLFLARYDSEGNCRWGVSADIVAPTGLQLDDYTLAVDPMGDVTVAGWFIDSARLGKFALTSTAETLFLARISQSRDP